MVHIITIAGVLICLTALAGLALPQRVTGLAAGITASEPLKVAATVARLLLGGIAILASNATLYPLAMKVIGVVIIMAGTAMSLVNAESRARWADSVKKNPNQARAVYAAGLLAGGFLIHASL